jgi:hypothetical protein
MTTSVRQRLETVARNRDSEAEAPLVAYANGQMSREDAIAALKLRDYAELLVALGDHRLVPPRPTPREIEKQAALFERLWEAAS